MYVCVYISLQHSIIGSGYVAAQYVKNQLHYSGKVFVIGSKGIQQELAEAGMECIGVGVCSYSIIETILIT